MLKQKKIMHFMHKEVRNTDSKKVIEDPLTEITN